MENWGPIPENFSRISEESVTKTCSREIPRKFLKGSGQNWRTFVTWAVDKVVKLKCSTVEIFLGFTLGLSYMFPVIIWSARAQI